MVIKSKDYSNEEAGFNTFENEVFHQLSKEGKETMYLVTYKFMLPYRLPITNGSTFSFKNKYLFKFINKVYPHPAIKDLAKVPSLRLTIVEATVRITRKEYRDYPKGEQKRTHKDKFISNKFDELLEVFNKIVVGISLVSKNDSIFTVKPMDFIGELAMIIYTYANNKTKELEKNIVNTSFRGKRMKEISQVIEYEQYITAVKTLVENDDGNYVKIHEKIRESDRLFFSERYDDSIVTQNTVFEMFTTNIVLRYEKIIKNTPETKLYNLSNNTGFANIISDKLTPIIRKHLNLKDKDLILAMIDKFSKTHAKNRHSIVHRGESFGLTEAGDGKQFLDDMILLIIDNITRIEKNDFTKEFMNYNVVTKPHVVQETIDKHKHLLENN